MAWWSKDTRRGDINEHGVGKGGYSTNDGHHQYNDLNITDRQQQVIEAYIGAGNSLTDAAAELGITKDGVAKAIAAVGRRLDIDSSSLADIREAFLDAVSGETAEGDDDDNAEYQSPWSGYWDPEGNWIP